MTRSWLYVPGDRPERITKATASEADVVIIDLEDAVKPGAKIAARANALAALTTTAPSTPARWVRINSGDEGRHDLAALATAEHRPDGLVLAKCEHAEWVTEVHWSLPGIPVAPLVETAVAMRDIDAIVTAPGVTQCHLGEVDLLADLGGRLPGGQSLLDHARVRIVMASAAAGIGAPIGGVHLQIDDLAALATGSSALADLGFGGRAVVHPSHCSAVNVAFTPSAADVAWAQEVLELLAGSEGAVRDSSGQMIDEAVARRARRIVATAR